MLYYRSAECVCVRPIFHSPTYILTYLRRINSMVLYGLRTEISLLHNTMVQQCEYRTTVKLQLRYNYFVSHPPYYHHDKSPQPIFKIRQGCDYRTVPYTKCFFLPLMNKIYISIFFYTVTKNSISIS